MEETVQTIHTGMLRRNIFCAKKRQGGDLAHPQCSKMMLFRWQSGLRGLIIAPFLKCPRLIRANHGARFGSRRRTLMPTVGSLYTDIARFR